MAEIIAFVPRPESERKRQQGEAADVIPMPGLKPDDDDRGEGIAELAAAGPQKD